MEEEPVRPRDVQPEAESALPVSASEAMGDAGVDEPDSVAKNEVDGSESAKVEEEKMIEPHAPHESIHTWKDVFIHIGIVTVGLLLAIGLEQTVEYFHHRHQVAETRRALEIEKRVNIRRFAIETQEFRRYLPTLEMNLKIYQYLREHPGAAEDQWPGKFSWSSLNISYVDSAWKTAQQSNVLQYMPQAEVTKYGTIYERLDGLSKLTNDLLADAKSKISLVNIQQPDPRKLSIAQLDEQILMTSQILLYTGRLANAQRNLNSQFPEFAPSPTREELASIAHNPSLPEEQRKVEEEILQMREADKVLQVEANTNDEGK